MATLREVAEEAGVSIRTVWRALRGKGEVADATRVRVERAARELGYAPDPVARSLKLRRGYGVCVVLGETDDLMLHKVVAAERVLREAGHTTHLVFNTGGDAETEREHVQLALAQRAAGLIVFTAARRPEEAAHLRELHARGFPYVLVDRQPEESLDAIRIDRAGGIAEAIGWLLDRDHREVAYAGPRDEARFEGFARAFRERGLSVPERHAFTPMPPTEERGAEAAAALARIESVTAAFAYSDHVAWGLLRALAARGIDVPGRLSVIGFDDRTPSAQVTPRLSTVAHPNAEVGRLAAEVVLGKLAGSIRPGEGTRLAHPSFVERESTRALA